MHQKPQDTYAMFHTNRPYVRWWWFSIPISKAVLRGQLEWIKENGFGGVEISWVYPLPEYEPGVEWLSPEWTELVTFTKKTADALGVGVDFTLGSLWPFGGKIVPKKYASRTFHGISRQRLRKSWEEAHNSIPGYILNHLDADALKYYFEAMRRALSPALTGSTSALFCDSWEVHTEGLWTSGMDARFEERFGYSLEPYKYTLSEHPHVRYHYRRLIADIVTEEFYSPLVALSHEAGSLSRVQCHGAPTDLLCAYAAIDIPETEVLLFDPEFSVIAASAAAKAQKPVVSCETFTCMYGWMPSPGPGPYLKNERILDLKLLVDATFAQGVNRIVWHGMPYNPPSENLSFYATVHVGPEGALSEHIPGFNRYIEEISCYMSRGVSYSPLSVYLPWEDQLMRGALPAELQKPSAHYYWELQTLQFPEGLHSYRPLWVSAQFLKQTRVQVNENGKAAGVCGGMCFQGLFLEAEWLEEEVLVQALRLAGEGLPVYFRGHPHQPGVAKDTPSYTKAAAKLHDVSHSPLPGELLPDVSPVFQPAEGTRSTHIPHFWIRKEASRYILFFANPLSREITYPMEHGKIVQSEEISVSGKVTLPGIETTVQLRFAPYQSITMIIKPGGITEDVSCRFLGGE